jgi:hypothetical protein
VRFRFSEEHLKGLIYQARWEEKNGWAVDRRWLYVLVHKPQQLRAKVPFLLTVFFFSRRYWRWEMRQCSASASLAWYFCMHASAE